MDPIDQAAEALDAFATGPGADAANALAEVFETAGDRIASSLERAAQTGELSFNALADSILSDVARLAVSELITAPLVGFVSSLSSEIASTASSNSAPVTVNLKLASGVSKAGGPQASAAQIAGQVAGAVARVQSRI